MNPTIVIPAFNRPKTLQRLLDSLLAAAYPPEVGLVVVIDAGGEQQAAVERVAQAFVWPFGAQQVIVQPRNLGLIGNIFFCGALALEYGSIVLLEDDLYVSSQFYRFATAALAFYREDERVAGISLNALSFNGITRQPFEPLHDGADAFFMQVAWYQGQAYSAKMWRNFQQWQANPTRTQPLHEVYDRFADTEWFPLKMRYLAETGRYFVFPRASLTTNFGAIGTHFAQETHFFQVPLLEGAQAFRFLALDAATAVYDGFQELGGDRLQAILTLQGDLKEWGDVVVDLNGTRSRATMGDGLVLTTRASRRPIANWGMTMRPMVANVLHAVAGAGIVLSRVEDVDFGRIATYQHQARLHRYFDRHGLALRVRLRHWLIERVSRFWE